MTGEALADFSTFGKSSPDFVGMMILPGK